MTTSTAQRIGGAIAAAGLLALGAACRGANEPRAAAALVDPCTVETPPPLSDHSPPLWITNQATDGAPISLIVADVDGDQAPDIVVSRGGFDPTEKGVLEILYGPFERPADPCAAGSAGVHAARAWHSDSTEAQPFAKLALGQIGGDECTDVVVGNFAGGVDVFLARKAADGRCELPTKRHHLDVPGGPPNVGVADVKLADLDGDGSLDLVAARVDRAAYMAPQHQAILWNRNGDFLATPAWMSDETLTGALAIAVLDVDGDRVKDVLFGARAEGPDGARHPAWASLYRGVAGHAPNTAGVLLPWAHAPAGIEDTPFLLDIDAWKGGGATRLVATSSAHLCWTARCADAARPQGYQWSGTTMVPVTLFPASTGDWFPGAAGPLDGDDGSDAVFPLACGNSTQKPGRLMIYRSKDHYAPRAVAVPQDVVRAAEIGDLDATSPGLEIAFGGVTVPTSSDTTETGRVGIVYECPGTH